MHGQTREAIEAVQSDRRRGSEAISSDALEALANHLEGAPADDAADLRQSTRQVARRLAEARPAMRVLPSLVAAAWRRLNAAVSQTAPLDELRERGAETVRGLAAEAADARAAAGETAREVLADAASIVTLSRSSTIHQALAGLDAAVQVLASEPGGEGHDAAAALLEAGVDARVAPDAYASGVLDDADALAIGADGVTRNGGAVNKVGSRTAAAAAARQGVPVWVVCSTWKCAPGPDPSELADWNPQDVPAVDVPLFEVVPEDLVDGLATERGPIQPREAAEVARRRAKDMASLGLDLG